MPPPLSQQIQTKSAGAPLLLRAVCNGVEHTQQDNGVAPLYSSVPVRDAAGNAIADFRYTCFHNDHLGTPRRLTDKASNLLWSAQYDAYGKAVVQTTASAQLVTVNPLRQPGQYLDTEICLHCNDRKYYAQTPAATSLETRLALKAASTCMSLKLTFKRAFL